MNKVHELNQAVEQVKAKQQEELVIDFDKSCKEEKQIKIVFEGQEFFVGTEPTTEVAMFLIRKGKELSDPDTIHLFNMIFGEAFMDVLGKSKRSFKSVVNGILLPVMEQWGYGGTEYKEEKKTVPTPAP